MQDDDNFFRDSFKEFWNEIPLAFKLFWGAVMLFCAGVAGVIVWAIISVVLHYT